MYDSMIFRKLHHGTEVIFINIVDGKETIYEDWFDHHDIDQIAKTHLKEASI